MASAAMAQAPGLRWHEIGRAAPEDECWVAWVALGGCGSTAYRCLIAHGGAVLVTVDLYQPGAPQPRRVHSGQRDLPAEDDAASARCIRELLEDADQAARTLLASADQDRRRPEPRGPAPARPLSHAAPAPGSSRYAGPRR